MDDSSDEEEEMEKEGEEEVDNQGIMTVVGTATAKLLTAALTAVLIPLFVLSTLLAVVWGLCQASWAVLTAIDIRALVP